MKITPRNWDSFQHYKNRNPPWIRLYKSLLDDFDFHRLPVASKALAPLLWLLASEYSKGSITATPEQIAFRVRMSVKELYSALKPLCDAGFFTSSLQDASTALAESLHDARPETESEERDSTASLRSAVESLSRSNRGKTKKRTVTPPLRFEEFYTAYPRHTGRGAAEKAWLRALNSPAAAADDMIAAAKRYAVERAGQDQTYTAHPATWLNQKRWLDEPAKPNGHGMSPALAETMRAIQEGAEDERENLKRMGVI